MIDLDWNTLEFNVPVSERRTEYRLKTDKMISDPDGVEFHEVSINSGDSQSSLQRKPTGMKDFVRGKIGNVPFKAGGGAASEDTSQDREKTSAATADDSLREKMLQHFELLFKENVDEKEFEATAPGLSGPLDLSEAQDHAYKVEPLGVNPKGLFKPYENVPEEEVFELQRKASQYINQEAREHDVESMKEWMTTTPERDDDLKIYPEAPNVQDEPEPPMLEPHVVYSTEPDDLEKLLAENHTGEAKPKTSNLVRKSPYVEVASGQRDFDQVVPDPALEYPFELDGFQKEAIMCIEEGKSVFIAAHTSAGKTVVAEYAIALAQKHMTRVIYTSPIKALSNQKFRDFREKFGEEEVGIITGDVSINPQASCLVMTTEILRSMLYRGADLVRDIEWVIFDEIHYINDSDRGVVWEEVIIMLPEHVNMVFLSATTPNTFEFSDWIGRTKKKMIHVISTTKRPVPLEHFLFVNDDMIKIMDSSKTFLPLGHSKAVKMMKDSDKTSTQAAKAGSRTATGRGRGQSGRPGGDRNQWTKLVKYLEKRTMLPVVVFTFSKRLCEDCAFRLSSVDLSSDLERKEIKLFVHRSIKRLQGSDQELPQVLAVKDRLMRGIGVHHGGLLPIIKEMVEILFARGLVKVLFATETFAMGVNMPARTVVFNGMRKHDGTSFRPLLPGEYTQMAGRAGRRGLDKVGTVVLTCWQEVPELQGLRTMLTGQPTRLASQFRLTYTMILNLLRVEDMTVEDMIKRSFSEFRTQKVLAAKDIRGSMKRAEQLLEKLRREFAAETCIKGGPVDIEGYYNATQEATNCKTFLHGEILRSKHAPTILCPGRLIGITLKGLDNALGLIVKVANVSGELGSMSFVALVLCPEDYNPPPPRSNTLRDQWNRLAKPLERSTVFHDNELHYVVLDLDPSVITALYKAKTTMNSRSLLEQSSPDTLRSCLDFLRQSELEQVDARYDLKMNGIEVVEAHSYLNSCQEYRLTSKCHDCSEQTRMLSTVDKINRVVKHCQHLKYALSNDSLSLFPDFLQRLQVLETLGYIDSNRTVQLKGRVACEINTCEELILTELIFENVLSGLTPQEIVALLSALVFQEKHAANDPVHLTPRLVQAKDQAIRIAESLAVLQLEHFLDLDPLEYIALLNFGLSEVVHAWASGLPFKQICMLTEVQEGSIVRCITRLDEVCREVRNIARVIGDPRLFTKMEIASESIKRDVVFATSLYMA